MTPTYLTAAVRIRDAIQQAMEEAKALLPPEVARYHYIAGKHSPAAWRSVEAWFSAQADHGERARVLNILTDLALLGEALAALKSVTTKQESRAEPNLSLKKTRHVEA